MVESSDSGSDPGSDSDDEKDENENQSTLLCAYINFDGKVLGPVTNRVKIFTIWRTEAY